MEGGLSSFFYGSFEAALNEAVLERAYKFVPQKLLAYLRNIASIPCEDFVDHVINKMSREGITTNDIPQFSNWLDGTDVVCEKILEAGDQGYSIYDVGKMLRGVAVPSQRDEVKKFIVACRKYGEGHAKLARSLGLLQECENVYFLSCIGLCWRNVPPELKARLYTRLILRTKFVRLLLQDAASGPVSVKALASCVGLSAWSIYRRHSNVVCLLDKLAATDEYDFSPLISRIDTDSMLERP